ncbi:hypothetical protein ABAC460_14245 [Asticcacaulis sp. AC460]|uniref:hypothetical protein n=1 Tax=Asticcacaulis sp. AC460 TaxID=1282360 RepID=UPI0003C3BAFD|nr:hypothetical protein [Asticcacaulis sp. AC460]ESQ88938.1 hypothetical protein ABAC460_14245 [Asticcacaulis sp. AC460]
MIKTLVAAAAVLAFAAAIPNTALARTDAENMRCRAVGETMLKLGGTLKETVGLLRENLTTPTAEDTETLNQMDELAASTKSVGEALAEIYKAAPTPTEALMDELNNTGMDDLIKQAEACVDA